MSEKSSRISSFKRIRAWGTISSGSWLSCGIARAWASISTRKPCSARLFTCRASSWDIPSCSRYSGAPTRVVPRAVKPMALHFRAEEKGTRRVTGSAGSRGPSAQCCLKAWKVGLSSSEACSIRRMVLSTCSRVKPGRGITSPTCRQPLVMVPVLSTHRVSTRARFSMPYSSCTRVFCWPRRTTPTASAMLVKSIRPSGIMPIMAATEEGTAWFKASFKIQYCLINRVMPMGSRK